MILVFQHGSRLLVSTSSFILQQRDASLTGYNGEYVLRLDGSGTVGFFIHNGGFQFDINTTATVNDGEWHHIVAVRDDINGYIFIDGVLAAQSSGPLKALVALGVSIGYDLRDSSSYFDGSLDDIRIYSKALTETEVNTLADLDTDGIHDAWEAAYFSNTSTTNGISDTDNDGQNDVSEFQAGTNPTDATDILEITEVVSAISDNTVKWTAKTGKTYTIKYSYDLDTWNDAATGQASNSDQVMTFLDTDGTRATADKVFYRVIVE